VPDNDAGEQTRRPQPVVFAAAGARACRTVGQVPQVARDLRIRVAGPFGVVAVPSRLDGEDADGEVGISDCSWLSDLEVPAAPEGPARPRRPGDGDEALAGALTALVRRLRVDRPSIAPDASPRVHVCAYVVADLSEPGAPEAALRIGRLLRAADASMDITALAMTGRTAESQADGEQPWFEAFTGLIERLQRESVFRRLYVLDGRDTNNTWLQHLAEMQRLGAEFLLHHGLSPYRSHLRRKEQGRVGPGQDFLHVCGSFCCRVLRSDRAAVARGIAAQLAGDLAELSAGTLSEDRSDGLDRQARSLADEIVAIYQAQDADAAGPVNPLQDADRDGKVLDAIRQAIAKVCAAQPVLSLEWFLKKFRPLLNQLSTSTGLADRVRTRYRTARTMRGQETRTYKPIATWLGVRGAVWQSRYDPYLEKGPPVRITRPMPTWAYGAGMAVLAAGLAGLVATAMGQPAVWAILGGVLAIAAAGAMGMASDSSQDYSVPLAEGDSIASDAKPVAYHRRPPAWAPWVATGLLIPGLIAAAAAASLTATIWGQSLERVLAGLLWWAIVLAGFVLQTWPPRDAEPVPTGRATMTVGWWPRDTALDAQGVRLPWMMGPPPRGWRVLGLFFLVGAWAAAVGLGAGPKAPQSLWGWAGLLGGAALILGGVGLLRWPWTQRAYPIYWAPRRPQPLETGLAEPARQPELIGQVRRITPWVETLLAEGEPARTGGLDWPAPRPSGTILEALVDGWDKRLADVFRRTLRAPAATLADMAGEPERWADYLVAELAEPTVGLADPGYFFALHAVTGWLEDWSWADLIAELRPDPQWFEFFVTRIVSPRWPPTRNAPEADASVIAVGETLWPVVAPLAEARGAHRLLKVDWHDGQALVVIRIVQGLTGGWRNFDPLPTGETSPA